MKYLAWLPALLLAFGLFVNTVNAEQILLSDGRYLQGSVVEVKETGFTFKLTESGGTVFLRWNQVDEALKKRLTNKKDPDEDLNLSVMVPGARLEMIDGTVYEGEITHVANGYKIKNFEMPNGKVVAEEDVMEDGFIKDISIQAAVMLAPKDVLKLAEEQRNPLETARQFYELARIADRLALYQEAKDYVTLAIGSGPDADLQARLTQYDTELDELIRQAAVLDMLVKAREQAKKKVYQVALNILTEAKDTFKPTGAVLAKVDQTYSEMDAEFTNFVIEEWYKQLKPVATAFLKLKENKEITAPEAATWARRPMDMAVADKVASITGSTDSANIKKRFTDRAELEQKKLIKLTWKKASFGESGFYENVGGILAIAGRKPEDNGTNPNGSTPPGRDRDELKDPAEGFQNSKDGAKKGGEKGPIKLPEGITEDDIKEALKRAMGDGDGEDEAADQPKAGRPDINKLREKAPAYYPSLQDWWDKTSTTTRAKWMVAVYVTGSGTMVYDQPNWDIKFK